MRRRCELAGLPLEAVASAFSKGAGALLGDVGIIMVNNPPVNALSPGVPEGIRDSMMALRHDAAIRAIVLIGGGRTFIAGADIKEFGKITSGQRRSLGAIPAMLQALEESPKPVVAAIWMSASLVKTG